MLPRVSNISSLMILCPVSNIVFSHPLPPGNIYGSVLVMYAGTCSNMDGGGWTRYWAYLLSYILRCAAFSVQCEVFNNQGQVCSVYCSVCSVHFQRLVFSIQCTVCNGKCAVFSVCCTVCNVQCTVFFDHYSVLRVQY